MVQMSPTQGQGCSKNLKFEICFPPGHVPHSVLSQPITRLCAHRALNGANLRGIPRGGREGGRLLGTNAAGKIRQLCRSSHNCAARSQPPSRSAALFVARERRVRRRGGGHLFGAGWVAGLTVGAKSGWDGMAAEWRRTEQTDQKR